MAQLLPHFGGQQEAHRGQEALQNCARHEVTHRPTDIADADSILAEGGLTLYHYLATDCVGWKSGCAIGTSSNSRVILSALCGNYHLQFAAGEWIAISLEPVKTVVSLRHPKVIICYTRSSPRHVGRIQCLAERLPGTVAISIAVSENVYPRWQGQYCIGEVRQVPLLKEPLEALSKRQIIQHARVFLERE